MRRMRRIRRGFTLIEVLLVAGILAVMMAFAVPNLIGRAEKTKIKLALAAIGRNGSIATALTNYKFDMGKYPSTDEGLAVLFLAKDRVEDQKYDGPYISDMSVEELKDPWGNAFVYRSPGEFHPDSYDLWSCGPDSKDDGGRERSDDVKNWIEK